MDFHSLCVYVVFITEAYGILGVVDYFNYVSNGGPLFGFHINASTNVWTNEYGRGGCHT